MAALLVFLTFFLAAVIPNIGRPTLAVLLAETMIEFFALSYFLDAFARKIQIIRARAGDIYTPSRMKGSASIAAVVAGLTLLLAILRW